MRQSSGSLKTDLAEGAGGVFGVFGDPIAHSRSPAMHGAAFAALGLGHSYLAFRVSSSGLPAALRGAAALGFRGVNLTVPHKRAALDLVDELSPAARRIGAINTVIFQRGRLRGENTDSPGFARALRELSAGSPKRAMVLGGGGAARAVVDALLGEAGVQELLWVSRDPSRLSFDSGHAAGRLRCLDYQAIAGGLGVELLVNCTTVGMHGGPTNFPVDLPLGTLEPAADGRARVVDIVYPRPEGGLLDQAAALGAAAADGREMLLWQGVIALEHWLGFLLPEVAVAAMRAALWAP